MTGAIISLFVVFLKIGFVGFGGGYAMMSMIISELDTLGITLEQFADLNALDMIVPGPIMINAATYVGYLNQGIGGALAATLAVCVPSFVLVSLVMRFLDKYRENRVMAAILSGIKPAAVGLIVAAALSIAMVVALPEEGFTWFLKNAVTLKSVLPALIFAATAAANIKFKVNPILLTVLAGIIGAVLL